MQVKNWKELQRHPLSEEYPNIDGEEWEAFVGSLRKNGIVNERKVTLHEEKVLDGYQLLRGCIEADVKPSFQELPDGISPEEFVEVMNDRRRHEDHETQKKRAQLRRQRVAEARVGGKSLRSIAEAEGISESQVRSDLQTSTAQGCAVEPLDGKITGKDGKKRKKPKKVKKEKPKDETSDEGTLLDSISTTVPPGLIPVFNKVKEFKAIVNELNDINRRLGELHKSAAGSPGRLQGEQIDLRNLKESVHFDMPYAVCPVCRGNAKERRANCPCKQRGWLVEGAYRNLPQEYRK